MVDTTIASADVTVLGGPSSVIVDVNFGPEGNRGSYIYSVLGIPGTTGVALPSDIQIYDIAINIKNESNILTGYIDPDYLKMYQYIVTETGSPGWVEVISFQSLITTSSIKINYETAFVSGQSVNIDLPLYGFTTLEGFAFNIQYNIESTNVVASSFIKSTYFNQADNQYHMVITINAAERSGSTWAALNNTTRMVNLSISAIGSNSVIQL